MSRQRRTIAVVPSAYGPVLNDSAWVRGHLPAPWSRSVRLYWL